MSKRGEILVENVIFIVLNLMFLSILILFVMTKAGSVAVLEEKASKKIALIIDSARPGMQLELDMKKEFKKAEKEGFAGKIVNVEDGKVFVRLKDDGGYSYSYFNDVEVSEYPSLDENNENNGRYIFIIE
jgi:hypothetical protein